MYKDSIVTLIAAISDNNIIGQNETIPWHLKSDLQHFKHLTTGHPCIMGRKTFESLPNPLPNRLNIVISSRKIDSISNVQSVQNINQAFEFAHNMCPGKSIFICGGAQVYKDCLPFIDIMHITHVHTHVHISKNTVIFPISLTHWKCTSIFKHIEDTIDLSFCTYTRKSASDL